MEAIRTPVLSELDLAAFERSLRGRLVRPDSAEYDTAREIQNAAYDRRPAVIVRPADATDVAATVQLAQDTGVELAVRSGGHSFAGHSMLDDAIVLDMGSLKGLHIDVDRRVAWAQAGLTANEYTGAAGAHGLATPFGDTASVGIAGLTLGGGIGYLVRKHGLAIDSLEAVEIVTADGRMLTASADEHPDLFWAVRGGGGNFGVVTRFRYRLHEVGTVLGGALVLPANLDVLTGMVDIASAAPEELSIIAFVMHAPPAPFIPVDFVGQLGVMLTLVYAGDPDEGQKVVAPFRSLAEPVADLVGPMPYPAIYGFTAEGEKRHSSASRSTFLKGFDGGTAAIVIDAMHAATSPAAMAQIRVLGGAMARVPADATAFAHRNEPIIFASIAPYEGPAAPHQAWASALADEVGPRSDGVYVNFLSEEGDARIRAAYPGGAYERLAAIKRRYDPANLFRNNQNVRPSSAGRQAAG